MKKFPVLSFLSALILSTSFYITNCYGCVVEIADEQGHKTSKPDKQINEDSNVIHLATLKANQGFVMQGAETGDWTGQSVSYAGDINADGISDVIVGAFGTNYNTGASYILYGREGGYPGPIDLAKLDASQGFSILGISSRDGSGTSVSYAGDINADGISDVIISAPYAKNDIGESYVIYGLKGGYPGPLYLADLDPAQGLIIQGAEEGDQSGHSVSYAGDINADGISDVIVGAWSANNNAGTSYVIYGNKSFSLIDNGLWKAKESVQEQFLRVASNLKYDKTFKNTLKVSKSLLSLEEKEKVNVLEDTQAFPRFSLPDSLPISTSDSISLRHHIPWYSPARWYEGVKALWSSSQTQVPLSSEAESLVSLKNKCKDLIEEAADKGYVFNLNDLVRDMEEALEYPQAITAKTVKRFESYLGDLNREYAREVSTPLSPYMQALLLGTTETGAPMSFTSKTELSAIGTLPQAPMLSFGTVLPALGN
ncbi:MAG: FG-GAP repeat protein [Alphaproteobacteria bacterium]|nr:FG-GAP repeat protein [Alphaproteobacteria bacterium]